MSRLGVRRPIPGINTPGRMDAIVEKLFPTHALRPPREWPPDEQSESVTVSEVRELALRIPVNKAPGADNIPGEAMKLMAKSQPGHLTRAFDMYLQQGVFQTEWKRVRLVLLRKVNRPLEES